MPDIHIAGDLNVVWLETRGGWARVPTRRVEDRPVAGARIQVIDASGRLVTLIETLEDRTFTITLPVGVYTFVPQPIAGLLGTPGEIDVVVDDPMTQVDIAYDTGIR
jgi:hypothetical protein